MGNTASAITCYPLKTGVMQGRLAVEGVMVISYFLCRLRHSVKHLSLPLCMYCMCVCVCAQVGGCVYVLRSVWKRNRAESLKVVGFWV